MEKKAEEIKKVVRDGYGKIARQGGSCCCGDKSSNAATISKSIGYGDHEINTVPEGANLGLGCGNPVALAALKEGDTVLDLGSGAGFDAFLAAKKIGPAGRVIGVDMTPEMIERAKNNAQKANVTNVDFRLGEIEKLPVEDKTVDVIISNCVINLSPDKESVFKEAFRVLKPGGRLMVSDLVLMRELPPAIKESAEAYVGCLAGAIAKEDYLRLIRNAGFKHVTIVHETYYPVGMAANGAVKVLKNQNLCTQDLQAIEHSVASIKVSAGK